MRALAAIRSSLPRGGTLPPEDWRQRHTALGNATGHGRHESPLFGQQNADDQALDYVLSQRWRAAQTQTTYVEPQLISGTSLIGLWEDKLAVVSTADGATIWSATEPFGSPLMNSAGSNGDTVFIAINSLPWMD